MGAAEADSTRRRPATSRPKSRRRDGGFGVGGGREGKETVKGAAVVRSFERGEGGEAGKMWVTAAAGRA